MAEFLQTFLADRDEPCPGCGYNLRGLTTDRCPECSQVLVLRVGLAEPRMGWYLTAVIGAAAGLGLNGLLLIYIVVQLVRFHMRGAGSDYFIWHNAIGALVHGGLLLLLAANGPRLRRADRWVRVLLAAAMWGVSLVNVGLFSVLIRR